MKKNRAVIRATAIVGSQTELAKKIGASQSQVSDWCNGRVRVPLLRAYQIAEILGGQVTAEEISPWFFKEAKKIRKSKSNDTCVS